MGGHVPWEGGTWLCAALLQTVEGAGRGRHPRLWVPRSGREGGAGGAADSISSGTGAICPPSRCLSFPTFRTGGRGSPLRVLLLGPRLQEAASTPATRARAGRARGVAPCPPPHPRPTPHPSPQGHPLAHAPCAAPAAHTPATRAVWRARTRVRSLRGAASASRPAAATPRFPGPFALPCVSCSGSDSSEGPAFARHLGDPLSPPQQRHRDAAQAGRGQQRLGPLPCLLPLRRAPRSIRE